jgi:RNA polymerase sigma-70 factor, ECF subfamily
MLVIATGIPLQVCEGNRGKMMGATSIKTQTTSDLITTGIEQAWIQAAKKGDLQAFNQLVLTYQETLYNWACYLVNDSDLAADLTQTVFITAYEKIKTFHNGSFRSWLFQIAKNRSIDLHRSRQRHHTLSLNQSIDDDNEQEWIDQIEDRQLTPNEQIEQMEQAYAIQHMLQKLPEVYRSVLVLVDVNEMDYEEAAQTLRVPLGTIKSRLVRARLKMREFMKEAQLV